MVRKSTRRDNVITAEFGQTKYDYKLQSRFLILLLARDSKGGPGNGRTIQVTPGFNFSTFLEMGQKGYLTGQAKKDYTTYMKEAEAGQENRSLVFYDSGIGVQEKISTTSVAIEEEECGYSEDLHQG